MTTARKMRRATDKMRAKSTRRKRVALVPGADRLWGMGMALFDGWLEKTLIVLVDEAFRDEDGNLDEAGRADAQLVVDGPGFAVVDGAGVPRARLDFRPEPGKFVCAVMDPDVPVGGSAL